MQLAIEGATVSTSRDRRAGTFATVPYPGEIPTGSFALDHGAVRRVAELDGEFCFEGSDEALTDWLADVGPRFAVTVSYGSNQCPGRLVEKFGPDVHGIAALAGTLIGAAPAWCANRSQLGRVSATLVADPHARTDVHLLVVPEEMADVMDRSEGRKAAPSGNFFPLVRLGRCQVQVAGGVVWDAPLAYLGLEHRGPMLIDGSPALLREVPYERARALAGDPRGPFGADRFTVAHTPVAGTTPACDATTLPEDAPVWNWARPL
jgi:hypothetical protein